MSLNDQIEKKIRKYAMQAIEFIGKSEKGSIKVPKEYQEQLQDQFRVIILQEAVAPKKSANKKRTLNAVKIKTKGFKFNRDEANAR